MALADQKLFLWINSFAGQSSLLDEVMTWLVSDYLVPVSLALMLVGLWFAGRTAAIRQRYQIGMFVALTSMGLSSLAVFISNAFYFRPRPFDAIESVTLLFYRPTDSSFPSNAAAAAFGIAFVIWAVHRRVGTFAIIGAALYGFARVYSGVHYPLDIVGGAIIAAAMTVVAFSLRWLLDPIPVWALKAARIFCLA